MRSDLERGADRLHDSFGHHEYIGDAGNTFQDGGELIAAHARDGIHFTNALQQSGRHEFQQLIADIVPQRIIDGFESIQVEQHDRQG